MAIWNRSIIKLVTEKEYDDIDNNRIVKVTIDNTLKIFGVPLFSKKFDEDLLTVDGGEYKSKDKTIGFSTK